MSSEGQTLSAPANEKPEHLASIVAVSAEDATRPPSSRKRSRSPRAANSDRSSKRNHRRDHRGKKGSKPPISAERETTAAFDRRQQTQVNKRKRQDDSRNKPIYAMDFSKEEIDSEMRRPKKKVAVMVGYSGSGYKGLQLSHTEKTVEGDLFAAFVTAGAISKANADDPKKSSLVRCARTDKGVHAAGNVLSLKLIMEDEDIVRKINSYLPPQIRVWGIQRTNAKFSAYQACDSRIYEYLIPTHCFIPPHPQSFLAKKLEELAEEAEDVDAYRSRQEDMSSFWVEVEETVIKPVVDELDPELAKRALQAIFETGIGQTVKADKKGTQNLKNLEASHSDHAESIDTRMVEGGAKVTSEKVTKASEKDVTVSVRTVEESSTTAANEATEDAEFSNIQADAILTPLESAIRAIKSAYLRAKLAYRITPSRLARVKSTLGRYVGTHRFHNYTPGKTFKDPSVKRHIRSFVVSGDPLLINGTEWLSLKVHGQSFMMHQIRKMVSMVAMVVRCGTHEARTQESFEDVRISIPRAPSLGLLLERPIFDSYNKNVRPKSKIDIAEIGFEEYKAEMDKFKQREIYERMWREEEKDMQFHGLFAAIDALKSPQLLYVSSGGIEATRRRVECAVENLDKEEREASEDEAGLGEEEAEQARDEEEG